MLNFDVESHYIRLEKELFSTKDLSDGHACYLIESMFDLWAQMSDKAKDRARERDKTRAIYVFPKNLPH